MLVVERVFGAFALMALGVAFNLSSYGTIMGHLERYRLVAGIIERVDK